MSNFNDVFERVTGSSCIRSVHVSGGTCGPGAVLQKDLAVPCHPGTCPGADKQAIKMKIGQQIHGLAYFAVGKERSGMVGRGQIDPSHPCVLGKMVRLQIDLPVGLSVRSRHRHLTGGCEVDIFYIRIKMKSLLCVCCERQMLQISPMGKTKREISLC